MISITNKSHCCGCSACAQKCPKHAITMQSDEEGFLYPQVDKSVCVNCDLCEKVCPILNKPQPSQVIETYAAKHISSDIKLKSSSGGLFTAIAEVVLKENGVVFGAAFDENWNVVHAYAENLADLDKLRRSKYVQSNIGQTFKQAETFLKAGRSVLFTGTPCQIAGLKNYLGKEYKNLLTADIICHGVPSPKVWQKFLKENFNLPAIKFIDFRAKDIAWDASFLKITTDEEIYPKVPFAFKLFEKSYPRIKNIFRLPYTISQLYERPSCHACLFKGQQRKSDFTMGDLWGVKNIAPSCYDSKGLSVLFVNTERGKEILKRLNIITYSMHFDDIIKYNPYFVASVMAHPKRAEFFARYQTEAVSPLIRKCLGEKPLLVELFIKVVRKIGKHL